VTYSRRPGQSNIDLQNAKEFEDEVRRVLPGYVHVRTESTVDLDFYIPPIVVEVKEKRQKLTDRWLGNKPIEDDLFVLDELTVRKALKHWPYVWFVLKDCPQERIFLASISEVLSADRHRFNRSGKGKWVIDTSGFSTFPLEAIMDRIRVDIAMEEWKASCCVVPAPEV